MSDDILKTPPLFALKGQIAVHFLDGNVVEGDFATQDAFNIFLTVDDEPVMIPRVQIKFIKGKQGQQVEPDTSQANFETQPGPPKPQGPDTEELFWESKPADDEEEDDGTMVLYSEDIQTDTQDDEEDGTVILYPGEELTPAPVGNNDDDGTLILEPETPIPTAWNVDDLDEDDMTVVISDSDELPELEEDDKTVVVGDKAAEEISGTLLCVSGPHAGEVFDITSGIITIGRSSDNVIVLSNDKEISRHHAIVLQESGKFVIQDQNSLNGTFVNDEPVSGPRYLEDGDIILVGLSTFRYQAE